MNKTVATNRLNKDAAFVYGGYLLRYLSLIVLIPYYGRVLGPTGYGEVLAAMSLVSIVWLVVNYGFSITGARDLASASSEAERNHLYSRHFLARMLLVPLGIAVGTIGTLWSPILAADPIYGVLATIIGLLEAFNLGWFFQGLRQFRTSITVEALSYPLNVAIVLMLVRDSGDGIYVLVSLLTSVLATLTVSYVIAGKAASLSWRPLAEGYGEIKDATVIFIQGVNTVLMSAGAIYALSILSTPEEVSYFGTAERFVAVGLSLLGPAGQVLMPTIANLHLESRKQALRLVRKALAFETLFGLVALAAGVVLAPFALPFILGDQFDSSIFILQILVCMMPFAAITHALGLYLLVPLRKEKLLIVAISVGSVINLSFGIFAAHNWGGVGMAYARVAGEAMAAIILIILCLRLRTE